RAVAGRRERTDGKSLCVGGGGADGEYAAPVGGRYLESENPADGRVHALVPDSDADDVALAVAAASRAFAGWAATARTERAAVLQRAASLLEARLDEFAAAEARDQGKPAGLARAVDIPRAVHNLRFFASAVLHAAHAASDCDVGGGLNVVQRVPVGVAALVSPWNLPLYLATWKLAPAIASGCTCVLKPSEFTSLTAYMFAGILSQAGLPKGVVNIVFGTGPRAGAPLVSHKNVKLVSFTGGDK
ncbi:Aldehyde dehydrogenase 8 member A1, partial [Physocladia obscura]